MSSTKPIHTIVLDAGPILQNTPAVSTLLSKTEALVTTPCVTSEIKDTKARSLFDTTLRPFLDIKTPSPLSLKFVTDFARKTGDLTVLSKTDIEVIALAYELDCQRNGGDGRLHKVPGRKRSDSPTQDRKLDLLKDSRISPAKPEPAKIYEPTTIAPWAKLKVTQPNSDAAALGIDHLRKQTDNETEAIDPPEASVPGTLESQGDLNAEGKVYEPPSVSKCGGEEPSEQSDLFPGQEDSPSEDSEGWITPANIKRVQATEQNRSTSAISPESTLQVAIITTDFAMQNVILQIGLNLLSPTIQRIRNIRTYVLRCHACFQIVKDTSKQFCPRCGKPTLTRVSCSTNAKGEFKIHLKKNMQWNHRGDRYSIPKPVPGQANGKVGRGKGGGKGGWGQELMLTEDQKEYQRALGERSRAKATDSLDMDHLPGILTGDRGRAGGRPKIGAGRNVNSKKRA